MDLALVGNEELVIDGLNEEYLQEFTDYRKEDLKCPLTPRGLKMLIKKLKQWDVITQERLISHAIECGWKTVYYVEPPKKNTTRERSLSQDLNDKSWAGL
jgi:hypothetical protein